jgi:hypothetical protein
MSIRNNKETVNVGCAPHFFEAKDARVILEFDLSSEEAAVSYAQEILEKYSLHKVEDQNRALRDFGTEETEIAPGYEVRAYYVPVPTSQSSY